MSEKLSLALVRQLVSFLMIPFFSLFQSTLVTSASLLAALKNPTKLLVGLLPRQRHSSAVPEKDVFALLAYEARLTVNAIGTQHASPRCVPLKFKDFTVL